MEKEQEGLPPNIHIYAPRADARRVMADHCPDCKQRSRFIEFFTHWYGWYSTCLRCGRRFQSGEWVPFESYRYARRDSIAAAKIQWQHFTKAHGKVKETPNFLGI